MVRKYIQKCGFHFIDYKIIRGKARDLLILEDGRKIPKNCIKCKNQFNGRCWVGRKIHFDNYELGCVYFYGDKVPRKCPKKRMV